MFVSVIIHSTIEQESLGSSTFHEFSLEAVVIIYDKSNNQIYALVQLCHPQISFTGCIY